MYYIKQYEVPEISTHRLKKRQCYDLLRKINSKNYIIVEKICKLNEFFFLSKYF